ncbi:MAG: phosphatase PAP2 family protein [Candidatus Daviesbacteria bacterium]|nr:phosphatase PAP2 family protein [Candidatus Daviesbacteria bacterium]
MDNITLFFLVQSLIGQSPILDGLMRFGAEPLIYIMILLTLILGIKGKIEDKKAFLIIILTIPIAFLLIRIIHIFIFKPRPFVTFNFIPLVQETANTCFPSRHTTISAVIAFAFTYFKSKRSLLFLILMLWVGISRVYVGVHYPLDILGGFLVAAISLSLALQIKRILKKFLLT